MKAMAKTTKTKKTKTLKAKRKGVARLPVLRTNHGGHRDGAGRRTMFPGKRQRLTVHTSPEVRTALLRTAADLTEQRHETTTVSDATEWCLRMFHGLPVPKDSFVEVKTGEPVQSPAEVPA